MAPNLETIAKKMSECAANIGEVRVQAGSEHQNGVWRFYAHLPEILPKDAAISLCRGWAQILREALPERHDDWSSIVEVWTPLLMTMGVYCIGRVGHEDTWVAPGLSEEGVNPQEWEILYQQFDAYLHVRGKSDWQGGGDYYLFDEWSGYADHSITIYRIEFLTPDLVSGIQGFLRDSYASWMVYIVLDLLPPVEGISSDGLEIHADRIVEKWDRAFMVERLGERLKV